MVMKEVSLPGQGVKYQNTVIVLTSIHLEFKHQTKKLNDVLPIHVREQCNRNLYKQQSE